MSNIDLNEAIAGMSGSISEAISEAMKAANVSSIPLGEKTDNDYRLGDLKTEILKRALELDLNEPSQLMAAGQLYAWVK